MNLNPKVSVIMPVYNAENFVKESIKSVLQQTYDDYELLIINDGSKDKSVEVIQAFKDKRIRLLHNEKNLGLTRVRNRGINEAKGKYIAWLDADDISFPTRLEKQVKILDNNSDIGLCTTNVVSIDVERKIISKKWYQEYYLPLEWRLFWENKIAQSSVMLRKELLDKYNLRYREDFSTAEDYDLWCRLALVTKFYRISEVLLYYRVYEKSTFRLRRIEAYNNSIKSSINMVKLLIKKDVPECHKYLTVFPNKLDEYKYFTYNTIFNYITMLLKEANNHWKWDEKTFDIVFKDAMNRVYKYLFSLKLSLKMKMIFNLIFSARFLIALRITKNILRNII